MKKIIHISKYYFPIVGGIEDVCYNVVSILKGKADQLVVSLNDSPKTEYTNVNDIPVRRYGCLGKIASQPISFSLFMGLRQSLKSFRPDIVTLHLPNPLATLYLLLLLKSNVKLIIHWHSDIVAQKFLYYLIRPIEKFALMRADEIIVTSPSYLKHSNALRGYEDKCIVIPNIISLDKMDVDCTELVDQIKAKYQKKIVFFLGRHVEYKGLKYLIEAEKYIKSDCIILIAGSGPLTTELKKKSNTNRISFLGRINDYDIPAYMKAATVFAFPSISKNEAFGVALAEAMYCGAVPVTFTIPCSGVNWVNIKDITGLEVKNSDSKAFGEAIDRLLQDESLHMHLSNNAYNRVKTLFTKDSINDQIIKSYCCH